MASVAEPAAVLLHGIPELVTNDSAAGPGLLGIIPNAAVIIQTVTWFGWARPGRHPRPTPRST